MTREVDHHRWHARMLSWAAWVGTDRGVRGLERPGTPEQRITVNEADAQRVDMLLCELRRRTPMREHALRTYYLHRLWQDDTPGYLALGRHMQRRYGRAWAQTWVPEYRARRDVHRAVEILDGLDTLRVVV